MRDLYRKRGSLVWYGQFKGIDGVRHQVCLHTHDRAEADARLRKHARTEAPKDAEPFWLKDALEDLLSLGCADNAEATRRMYKQRGEQIIRVLPGLDCNRASRDDYQRLISVRLKEGASPSTVHKELVTIRRALTLGRERGLYTGHLDVLPKFKAKYVPRRRWLESEAFKGLLDTAPDGRRLWLAVAGYAGLRLSETEGLLWSDLDAPLAWLHVRGSKTKGSDRYIPVAKPLLRELKKVKKKDRTGLVCGPWPSCRRWLRRYAACSPNDLRRTFASWLKQAGKDSLAVAQLLGHTSTRMVEQVYGRLADRNLVDAVDAIR